MNVQINPGTYTFTMTLYDAAPVSGAIPSSAHALGTSTLGSITIAPSQDNVLAFSVEGIVSGVGLSGGSSFISLPANGSPHSAGLALIVTDASGAPISGTYATPIAVSLSESGGSGHTQLVLNGTPVGTSATLTSSSDTLGLSYDGGGAAGYTTTTTFGGVTGAVRMSPLYVSGPLTFSDQNQTKSISISEANSPFTSPPAVTWSCSGFSPAVSGTNASATYSVTSPSLVYDAAVPSFACPGTVTITDALGTSITTSSSGSLPVATYCASTGGVANLYLGATDGSGNYEASNGSACPLTPASGNLTVYAPPNDASHVGTLADAISEQRDTTTASVTATTCAGIATPSPALTPGATLASPLGGNVSVTSLPTTVAGTQNCSVMIDDNNGQPPKPVAVQVIPTVQTFGTTPTGNGVVKCFYLGLSVHEYACVRNTTVDFGSTITSGTPYTFTSATSAVTINATVSGGANWNMVYLTQGSTLWKIVQTSGSSPATYTGTISLPNGAGTYGLQAESLTGCLTSRLSSNPTCTPPVTTTTVSGSLVEAPNGTGTVTPIATTPPSY